MRHFGIIKDRLFGEALICAGVCDGRAGPVAHALRRLRELWACDRQCEPANVLWACSTPAIEPHQPRPLGVFVLQLFKW